MVQGVFGIRYKDVMVALFVFKYRPMFDWVKEINCLKQGDCHLQECRVSCKFVELTVGITSHINEVHGCGGEDLEVVGVISPHDLSHEESVSVLTVPSLGIRLLYAVKYQHL